MLHQQPQKNLVRHNASIMRQPDMVIKHHIDLDLALRAHAGPFLLSLDVLMITRQMEIVVRTRAEFHPSHSGWTGAHRAVAEVA